MISALSDFIQSGGGFPWSVLGRRPVTVFGSMLALGNGERDRNPSPASGARPVSSTGGRPHEWRLLEELDGATTDAIEFAAARGWVAIQGSHSICLTEAGRRLAEGR